MIQREHSFMKKKTKASERNDKKFENVVHSRRQNVKDLAMQFEFVIKNDESMCEKDNVYYNASSRLLFVARCTVAVTIAKLDVTNFMISMTYENNKKLMSSR